MSKNCNVMLEDRHIQIDLEGIKELLDFDIIVRTDPDQTQYVGFELYNNVTGEFIEFVKFNEATK